MAGEGDNVIKAVIAITKFGSLILDTDNEDFKKEFIYHANIENFINCNEKLTKLEKEPYGLYYCKLSWVDEDVYLESYGKGPITWKL